MFPFPADEREEACGWEVVGIGTASVVGGGCGEDDGGSLVGLGLGEDEAGGVDEDGVGVVLGGSGDELGGGVETRK